MAKKGVSVGVEITGSAKGFKSATEDAKKATDELRRKAAANSREMERNFKQLTMSITKVAGAAIAFKAGFDTISAVIKTTEGGSDKLESTIGGLKEGFFELNRAIASTDFSGFIKDLKEGFNRGKELTEALDDLSDKTAYNDYIIQGLRFEKAALQETVKNKTLDISIRADAAEKAIAIAEKIQKREEEIALKAFLIQKRAWEGRNKMATEEAIKLYETIDGLSSETEDQLASGFAYATDLFGNKKGIAKTLSGESGRGILSGLSEDLIQSYGQYLTLLNSGEADVLPKLFKTHKDYLFTVTSAQLDYNSAVKETTALLEKEEKALEKTASKADEIANQRIESAWFMIENRGAAGSAFRARKRAAGASVGDVNNYGNVNMPFSEVAKSAASATSELERQKAAVDTLTNAFTDMFMNVDQGFKGMIDSVIGSLKRLIAEMAGKAAVFGILSLLSGGTGSFAKFASGITAKGMGSFMGLAEGGIVTSPTLAMIGEGKEPEAVVPLSKLKGMMTDKPITVIVKGRFNGRDIYFAAESYSKMLNANT